MSITEVTMNNGSSGMNVDEIVLTDVTIDGRLYETYEVVVIIETGVQHPSPQTDRPQVEAWVRLHAASAIRTNDDRLTNRPNIWPDETQHADVFRAWHLDNSTISIWTTRAPKPQFVP